jgi:hypothetical protein
MFVVIIEMMGMVLITKCVSNFMKPETTQKSNGMLYFICKLGIGYVLGSEHFKTKICAFIV